MSKSKSKVKIEGNTISGDANDIIDVLNDATDRAKEKEVHIKSARIVDGFCNYSYEHKAGVTAGDECKRDGASVIHDDLRNAFSRLAVHFAALDDAFIVRGHHVQEIDEWRDSEIVNEGYFATGFKLQGSGDNETIIITGGKNVKHGSVEFPMPKIYFNGTYQFIDDLRADIDDCIHEVYLYLHGKSAPKMVQTEMELPEGEGEE
jgi:hypothetical protein